MLISLIVPLLCLFIHYNSTYRKALSTKTLLEFMMTFKLIVLHSNVITVILRIRDRSQYARWHQRGWIRPFEFVIVAHLPLAPQ